MLGFCLLYDACQQIEVLREKATGGDFEDRDDLLAAIELVAGYARTAMNDVEGEQ